MATNLTRKKPNFAKQRSHALNTSNKKQNINKQKFTINGDKVILSVREYKTLKKNQKAA